MNNSKWTRNKEDMSEIWVRKLRCPPNTLKNFSNYFPSRAIMPLARRALQTPTSLRWGVMPVLGTPTINYAILFFSVGHWSNSNGYNKNGVHFTNFCMKTSVKRDSTSTQLNGSIDTTTLSVKRPLEQNDCFWLVAHNIG